MLSFRPPRPGVTKVNPRDDLTYVWVPPGTFLMGGSDSEAIVWEKPAHQVTISKGFWIGQTPVTQEAFERVRGYNPSHFKGPKLPVENVDWHEAQRYCEAVAMRLPTEAEWEYAARAGNTASRYGLLDEIAWFFDNNEHKTHAVAGKQPNAWGLYDTLGNVAEWVADWYADYTPDKATDPQGPPSGTRRALRGGSFVDVDSYVRVSVRNYYLPEKHFTNVGFRCAGESLSL